MYECGTKDHVAAVLQCNRLCIIRNDSKICRQNFLSEMQHGGESSSTLPATASLNLAMRRARLKISQTGSRIATADLPKFKKQGRDFWRRSGGPFETRIGPRNTLSQSREADGKSLCRSMKLCCLTVEGAIVDAPMGAEFYAACRRVTPDIAERRGKINLSTRRLSLGLKRSRSLHAGCRRFTQDLPATKAPQET